jgi:uncharacterized protein YyaL (SSP411 family)
MADPQPRNPPSPAPPGNAAQPRGADGADARRRHTNALVRETSPYLLQHAHNPVEWYAWGEEAFERARQLQRPIFLSIGYSTCYWCHVMERQSFEDEAIAAVMNEHFVNIKVDREERPDVDDVYMTATQIMTGHGGWPMSVFLTPPPQIESDAVEGGVGGDGAGGRRGLLPFYCGTYFPPGPMHGRPGFPQLLEALSRAWRERRDEVVEQAERVAAAVREQFERTNQTGGAGELSAEPVQRALDQLLRMYDQEHGGFGSAPKFPTPSFPLFLLAVYRNNPDAGLWSVLRHTLDRMARGGMYDQVGGGFHRYSVDEKWLVPHFEKMLYDNGQLVELYATAYERTTDVTERRLYERIIRETCDYAIREMTDRSGAFWSAQDAEVAAKEGGNYVWTREEVEAAITDEAMRGVALQLYGLDEGPNFRDPHHPDSEPVNVLYMPRPMEELARELGVELDRLDDSRRQINARLKELRDDREQPATDDKVLTAWNGLMIAGLAHAGRVLDEPRYTQVASRAADAIIERMAIPGERDALYRTMRAGQAKVPGFLEDYAMLVRGLLALHRAQPVSDAGRRWLDAAERFTRAAVARFEAPPGGYFDTLDDARTRAELFVRTRGTHDGAVPSGNSQMVHNLVDLYELTDDRGHLQRAIHDLRSFAEALMQNGANMAHMQHALLRVLEAAPSLASPREPAATAEPSLVETTAEPTEVTLGPDASAEVRVTLRIAPGFHINASGGSVEGLVATQLTASGGGVEVAVDYPAPVSRSFPLADRPLRVYEGSVTLVATLRRTGEVGTSPPRLLLRYQACDESSCRAPGEEVLPVVVRLVD